VGMGRRPPQFLKRGQSMRVGISGLGIQTQHTVPATLIDRR
jgi:2-keto-4-pentenoate hydratase/2-oxohepta-3-ene-1,7-dioic acid hydratase in catechol pathway